jgi:hypothetical protein
MSTNRTEDEQKLVKKEAERLKAEADEERREEQENYIKQTDAERKRYFKGTIIVIIIYGLFILGMSIAGIVSVPLRDLLFVSGFPFTVTFISGVTLVIIILLAQLFTYKPAAMPEKYAGDNMSCPDFWVLKKTPLEQLKKIRNKKVRQLSKYYCVNPSVTTDIGLPNTITSASATSTRELRKLKEVSLKYTTIDGNYHMKCNRLYPDYMASVDKQNFPINPTAMRCAYLAACGTTKDPISWTGACPN